MSNARNVFESIFTESTQRGLDFECILDVNELQMRYLHATALAARTVVKSQDNFFDYIRDDIECARKISSKSMSQIAAHLLKAMQSTDDETALQLELIEGSFHLCAFEAAIDYIQNRMAHAKRNA